MIASFQGNLSMFSNGDHVKRKKKKEENIPPLVFN